MAQMTEKNDDTRAAVEGVIRESARPAVTPAAPRRKPVVLAVAGLIALVLVGGGVRQWWYGRTHISTDNAQVEGHITPILPRTGGFVAEVRVQDNEQVNAGDTLVVLDDRDLQAKLAQADAELAALLAATGSEGRIGQAAAQVGAARSAAAAASATIEQARANAQKAASDLERMRTLAERNIISQQQLDAARAASDAANAQLLAAQRNAQAAQDQVAAASAGLQAADARVAAARAARDQVALMLSYTRVTAPASGVVSKRSVEVGQLVQPGQPLMSVVPMNDVWVVANLKETEIKNVQPGAPVEIEVDAYPGVRFRGEVESLSPATGAKFSLLPPDNATGNFTKVVQRVPVKIRVSGQQDPKHPLRPGMSVTATVETK
jgi:membrane fusion protein (multidrug efflux system)